MKKAALILSLAAGLAYAVVAALTPPKQWHIRWDANPTNDLVTSYVIRSATNVNGPWSVIGTVDSNTLEYAIGGATNTHLFFVVTASNMVGESPFSDVVDLPALLTNGVQGVRFLQVTNN